MILSKKTFAGGGGPSGPNSAKDMSAIKGPLKSNSAIFRASRWPDMAWRLRRMDGGLASSFTYPTAHAFAVLCRCAMSMQSW